MEAFLAGAGLVALIAVVLVTALSRHARNAEAERRRIEAVAVKAREMLAASPDGLMLWDHVNGGFTCSRRLAAMLGLEAGTRSRYDDVRRRFEGDSLKALEQAVSLLRAGGTGFDLLLAAGQRRIQAIGARAGTDDETLADMVWMRDLTAALGGDAARSANTSGLDDRHLTALLDALPLPMWLRDSKLRLAFVNRAGENLAPADPALAERARAQGKSVSAKAGNGLGGEPGNGLGDGAGIAAITETPLGILGGGDGRATGGTVGFGLPHSAATDAGTGPAGLDVLEAVPVAVALFDADRRLAFANAAYAALWSLERDWLEGKPEFGQVLEKLRQARRLPEVADFPAYKEEQLDLFATLGEPAEKLLHLPDDRTLRQRISPVSGGLAFTFEDVSERLALERSINALGQVQRQTLDNLHEGIAVFGEDGRLKLSNPVFAGLWGLDRDALGPDFHVTDFIDATREHIQVQGGWDDLSWGVHRDRVTARIMGRKPGTGQIELSTGTVVDFANVPLPDGAVLLSYVDVTDSFRVEQALRARADALAEADEMKSKFIADVSFEIRTPLNTVIGFADMLGREYFGKLNNRQRDYARGILDTTRGLVTVVGDILDLASIEAGAARLDRDTVDVHGLMVQVLRLVEDRAGRKDIKVEFDCPPTIGWIAGDQRRLKQVAFNLMTNAIQFTPGRGTVRLEARREGDDLLIVVADTGIGIPQSDREAVFRPFEHGSDPAADKSGAGLGLSVARNFIRLHGGSIDIKSPPGRGTTVTCRIPAQGPVRDNADGGDSGGGAENGR